MKPCGSVKRSLSAALMLIFISCLILSVRGSGQSPSQPTPEIRIIVVDSQSEAEQILKLLKAGEDFATLAREKSIDPSAADGGSLGRVDPASLRTELRDALSNIGNQQLAGPVKISTSFAILKVEPSPARQSESSQEASPAASPGPGMSHTGLP